MEYFRKLGIIEPILQSIKEEQFEKPSEIQEKSIPTILSGMDVIAGSATGSGKTLAFGAAIIQNCERGNGIQALVLVPTRELAEQNAKALRKFSRYKPLAITAIYGGVSINPQFERLKTADVVIGTPGRILDHIDRRTIRFDRVKILVLDEADRMFDMGFIDDVEKIIRQCPQKRQTLLFSATITRDVAHIARRYMKNPVEISAENYVDPKKLRQVYYDVADNMKFSLLVHLLRNERTGLVMVFCNTQRNTDFVAENLRLNGLKALAIHGGLSQDKRTRTLEQFHSNKIDVLVCTDVAARGLDIKGVSHIYNYDSPKESKQYIHRIGRTARAGHEGIAINLISSRDYENFGRVLRDNDVNVEKQQTPQMERARIKVPAQNRRFGGFNRGRNNPSNDRFGRNRPYRR
jgi:ATP-dependent RNA helicase DeaD